MEKNYKLLVADDEEGVRSFLVDLLKETFEVDTVDRGDAVIESIKINAYDILLLDLGLPGMDGIQVLSHIFENKVKIAVVVVTATNDIDTAITSMKLGAYDYLVKPFDANRLMVILKNIVEKLELEKELNQLREQVGGSFSFANVIGKSSAMQKIFNTLKKVIDTNSTILITGESGTGKEVVAKAVHYNSNRKQYPFRSIDCSTIPGELIGSELFGHEKGAFTGAVSRKVGKFEIADNGTLFLDEVGNLSLEMQAKLLRVLQEKEFERIGGNEIIKVNTRIVAATNRDLRLLARELKFREDLYYRLNVVPVYLPPLRERKEDIPLFIEYFQKKFNVDFNRDIEIELKARLFLCEYDWPGNVRQMENVIKRLVLLSTKHVISNEDVKSVLEFEEKGELPSKAALVNESPVISEGNAREIKSFDEYEKEYIENTLKHFNYNISNTARALKLSRKTMHNKMKKYNIVIYKHSGADV